MIRTASQHPFEAADVNRHEMIVVALVARRELLRKLFQRSARRLGRDVGRRGLIQTGVQRIRRVRRHESRSPGEDWVHPPYAATVANTALVS